jgi:signal transduction histidine kinase
MQKQLKNSFSKRYEVSPLYALWIRELLESGDQKQIANTLSLQYVYVKQVLGGNRNKPIRSTNAIRVIEEAENLILQRLNTILEEKREITERILTRRSIQLSHAMNGAAKYPKTAKEKLESIYTLLRAINHDMKSPLNSFAAFIQLVEHLDEIKVLVPPAMLHEMQQNIQYLVELWNALNDWVIKVVKEESVEKSFHLNEVIVQSIELLSPMAEHKCIQLVYEPNGEDIELHSDIHIIKFVIRNLLHNAIKFTPENGKVYIRSSVAAPGKAALTIRDEGRGIPEEVLPTIFDLNTKKSTYGTKNEKGTGIGLALCKKMVNEIGGDIELIQTSQEGSTFRALFPLNHE